MFQNLQKRLTFLYTVTIGGILTIILTVCFFYMKNSLESRYESQFSSIFLNISNRFQIDSFFSDSWLAQMETDNRIIIHIEENESPLFFQGTFKTGEKRSTLIEKAQNRIEKQQLVPKHMTLGSSVLQTPVFTMNGNEKDYYMVMYLVESTSLGYKSLLVLQDITQLHSQLFMQGLFFFVTGISGIFLLFLASWYAVGRTLIPLKENQKNQAEFIAAASHELRSPLAVIQASASAIRTSPENADVMSANIEKECTRMGNLIKDLLVLAAADSRRWQLSQELYDSDTLLLEVYETFQPICYDKKLHLRLSLPEEELPRVYCDKSRVIQILTILIDNAMTYTQPDGFIDLEIFQTKKQICYSVADHGTGIPDSEKKLVFDRFYQSDKSRNKKEHFGLGLSIARELAELQKGSLTIEDTPGGGCTFLLKLNLSLH